MFDCNQGVQGQLSKLLITQEHLGVMAPSRHSSTGMAKEGLCLQEGAHSSQITAGDPHRLLLRAGLGKGWCSLNCSTLLAPKPCAGESLPFYSPAQT